jgi:hypothetical protein
MQFCSGVDINAEDEAAKVETAKQKIARLGNYRGVAIKPVT